MEQILDLLESNGKDAPVDDVEYAISKAEGLKEESKNMLRKERQDIIATAKAHGLSLEELGIILVITKTLIGKIARESN